MRKKLYILVRQQLVQGATPQGLALACALGVALGLFPIIGTTTALCLIVGTGLRLNQPLMQFVNYILYPVHLLSIPVFIYFGEFLTGSPHLLVAPEVMLHEFRTDFNLFCAHFGVVVFHAILTWAITAPPLAAAVFYGTRYLFGKRFKVEG